MTLFFSLKLFNISFLPCSAIILISFFFALHSFIFDPHFFYISCPTYLPSECSIYFLFIYATLGGCRNTGPLGGGWENFWIRALSSSLPSFIIIIIFIMIITIQFSNTRLVRKIFWEGVWSVEGEGGKGGSLAYWSTCSTNCRLRTSSWGGLAQMNMRKLMI